MSTLKIVPLVYRCGHMREYVARSHTDRKNLHNISNMRKWRCPECVVGAGPDCDKIIEADREIVFSPYMFLVLEEKEVKL